MYSVWESVGTAEVTQRGGVGGGGGGLTLLVPSLSGCAESCGGLSVTTWRRLNLLHVCLRLYGRGCGLRRRFARPPPGRGLCGGRDASLRYGGGRRWTRSISWRRSCGSGRWTVWSGVTLLRCSEALHDGGDPHSFLQGGGHIQPELPASGKMLFGVFESDCFHSLQRLHSELIRKTCWEFFSFLGGGGFKHLFISVTAGYCPVQANRWGSRPTKICCSHQIIYI